MTDPHVSKPCVACRQVTPYACVDCYVATGSWIHCCTSPECRLEHGLQSGCLKGAPHDQPGHR